MDARQFFVFAGSATRDEQRLVVFLSPASSVDRAPALEIAGEHAGVAEAALDLASRPVVADELPAALAARCNVDLDLAADLVERLLAVGVLRRHVDAAARVRVEGDGADATALRAVVRGATWPADAPAVTIHSLGVLGGHRWHDRLSAAKVAGVPAFTWSLEEDGAWIGPAVGVPDAPCPACLAARRAAARPQGLSPRSAVGLGGLGLNVACQHVLLEALRWATGSAEPDRVVHAIGPRVERRPLLRQPSCRHCTHGVDRRATPGAAEDRFRRQWALSDGVEPDDETRAAWIDPALGPLEIAHYDAPRLFRGLPLTLGSIRLLEPKGDGFARRELFSVTFGAGTTEARRRLVAYAEGIERYALTIDRPDVRGKRRSELGPEALSPAETIRFAPEQRIDAAAVVQAYDDQPIDWSWGCDWETGRARLLGHDAFAFDPDPSPGSLRWMEDPFSSGAAAHRSLPLAARRAVLELIERDAFMLAWYLRLPLPELDVSGCDDADIRGVQSYLEDAGIELRFFDMRVDFDLPTVLVTARARVDRGQWRAGGRIVAPSSAPTWRQALSHALQEILGHFSVFAVVSADGDSSIDAGTGEVRAWWPSFAEYFRPRSDDDPLSFLGSGPPGPVERDLVDDSLDASLAAIRAQLRERGLSVYVRHLGGDAVAPSGLVAVRACVPGLLRMMPSRSTMNLGEPRIDSVCARWGVPKEFNPLTHPLS